MPVTRTRCSRRLRAAIPAPARGPDRVGGPSGACDQGLNSRQGRRPSRCPCPYLVGRTRFSTERSRTLTTPSRHPGPQLLRSADNGIPSPPLRSSSGSVPKDEKGSGCRGALRRRHPEPARRNADTADLSHLKIARRRPCSSKFARHSFDWCAATRLRIWSRPGLARACARTKLRSWPTWSLGRGRTCSLGRLRKHQPSRKAHGPAAKSLILGRLLAEEERLPPLPGSTQAEEKMNPYVASRDRGACTNRRWLMLVALS
jgi:hypothetical protein